MNAQPVSAKRNGGLTAGRGVGGAWSFPTWLMICALVLYPLSVGPLSWCWEEVILAQDDANQFRARRDRGTAEAPFVGRLYVLPGIYQPLMWAYGATPAVRNLMDGYLRMWGRLLVLAPLPNFQFRFPKLSPWEDYKTNGLPVQISWSSPGGSAGTGSGSAAAADHTVGAGRSAVSDFLNGGDDNNGTTSGTGAADRDGASPSSPASTPTPASSEGAESHGGASGPVFVPCLYQR